MSKRLFCLMGPTASGKTALACELVQRFPCEIVSVDSALIYRGMDIGTAKPDAQIVAAAPHHLMDMIDPPDSYSAAQFCDDVTILCESIIGRGKIPLLVGGTMMYFRALQQGLSVLPPADEQVRLQLVQQAQARGWDFMHQMLAEVDPVAARRIHSHDTQRIQRALEVYQLTGKSLSTVLADERPASAFQCVNFILFPESRAWLHARIEQRFLQMLAAGFVDEVVELVRQWPTLTAEHPSMRCVGYRQVFDYLQQGGHDDAALRDKGIAATRQLAKRQLTWLRHWPNGHVFTAENPASAGEIMALMQQILDNTPIQ